MHTKTYHKTHLLIVVLFAFAVLFNGCIQKNKPKNSNPKYGGTLRMNLNGAPDNIFPGQVLKNSEQIIVTQVYDGLIKYNQQSLEIIPSIAKKWLTEREGTIYTFFLNSEAKFQNNSCFKNGIGRQITAADFKYSLEQICRNHIKKNYSISKQLTNIKGFSEFYEAEMNHDTAEISGITVYDDTTLVFRLNETDEMFIHFLAGTNGLVFPKEGFDAYGIESPVGSGAFYLKIPESKAQSVLLLANKEYYQKSRQKEQLPFLDSIYCTFISSAQQELTLLKGGQIDLILSLPEKYVTPFLDENIDRFQNNPPYYVMRQTVDYNKTTRYNILRANIAGLDLNSQGFFDFSLVYFEEPKPQTIEIIN